jgi:ribosomal-protein-alanine N-acetyltransferase
VARLERHIPGGAPGSRWSLFRLKRHLLLIAELDGCIVGYALAYVSAQSLHIVGLAVDPAWRRRGVASQLLHAIERYAGRRAVTLEARADNDAALALYRRHGYREVGRIERFYADGADALRLEQSSVRHES